MRGKYGVLQKDILYKCAQKKSFVFLFATVHTDNIRWNKTRNTKEGKKSCYEDDLRNIYQCKPGKKIVAGLILGCFCCIFCIPGNPDSGSMRGIRCSRWFPASDSHGMLPVRNSE